MNEIRNSLFDLFYDNKSGNVTVAMYPVGCAIGQCFTLSGESAADLASKIISIVGKDEKNTKIQEAN